MHPQPDKVRPAVYGGILMALLSSIPFLSFINCCCCAGVILGGVAAVFFYKSDFTPDTPPYTMNDCVVVGALAGVIGAVASTLLAALFTALFGDTARELIRDLLLNSNLDLPGDAREKIEELLAERSFTPVHMVLELFSHLVIDVVFGLLGGIIGYALWKPKPPVALTPMPRPE